MVNHDDASRSRVFSNRFKNSFRLVSFTGCVATPARLGILHSFFKISLGALKAGYGIAQVSLGEVIFLSRNQGLIRQIVNRCSKVGLPDLQLLEQFNRGFRLA